MFVSSVQDDEMSPFRAAAKDALGRIPNVDPWLFEDAPASSEAVEAGYLMQVAASDAMVLLVGANVSPAVMREVAQARGSRLRLWVFRVSDVRTEEASALVRQLSDGARYRTVYTADELSVGITEAFYEDAVLALRGTIHPTRGQLLVSALNASIARCTELWRAAGLDQATARDLANSNEVGALPPGWWQGVPSKMVVLVGGIGTGKSLAAERRLQSAILEAQQSATAPIPVHLRASDIGDRALGECIVDASEGLGDPRRDGAFVILDAVDETGAAQEGRLIRDARCWAGAHENSLVVVTTRHASERTVDDEVTMPEMSESQSAALMDLVAKYQGTANDVRRWPEQARASVRAPLFAIVAGLFLAVHRRQWFVPAKSDLLRFLVERALGAGRLTPESCFGALESVACDAANGKTSATRQELRASGSLMPLLESGLLIERRGDLSFGLPIISQWFAAQALLNGRVTVASIPPALLSGAWYYPLVLAIGAADEAHADAFLADMSSADVATTAKIVLDATSDRTATPDTAITPEDAGCRVRTAVGGWLAGVGALRGVLGVPMRDGNPAPVAIGITRGRVAIEWCCDRNLAVPPVVSMDSKAQMGSAPWSWQEWGIEAPSEGAAWAWRRSLLTLRQALARNLGDAVRQTDNAYLRAEAAWLAGCSVLRRDPRAYAEGIDVARLRRALAGAQRQGALGGNNPVTQRDGATTHNLSALYHFVESDLAHERTWKLDRPLPDRPARYFLGGDYSEAQLVALMRTLLPSAVFAYDDVVREWFPRFAGKMYHHNLFPAKLTCTVNCVEDVGRGGPSYSLEVEPLPDGEKSTFDVRGAKESTGGWSATKAQEWDRKRLFRPAVAAWANPYYRSTRMRDEFLPDAVTRMVHEWLVRDLVALKWLADSDVREFRE